MELLASADTASAVHGDNYLAALAEILDEFAAGPSED